MTRIHSCGLQMRCLLYAIYSMPPTPCYALHAMYRVHCQVISFSSCKGAAAGAFGCTISGAGPTCVAVVDNPQLGQTVAEAMVKAFEQEGKLEVNSARVVRLDQQGARTL